MNAKTAEFLNIEERRGELEADSRAFRGAKPFPYAIFEDFLDVDIAKGLLKSFPSGSRDQWIHYVHYNEKKFGLNRFETLPKPIQSVITELHGDAFLTYLSELTGIDGLMADDSLEGGGLHLSERGGFLNIHADFTVHPHHADWQRRLNLILYLNEGWEPDFKGDLELWSKDMKTYEASIGPLFNRCVIFATDADSYHGFPTPLECPEGQSRKSIALYYYTKSEKKLKIKSTNYRSRPGDGIKAFFIWADKQLVMIYTQVKKRLGLKDDFVSNVLRFFSGKKK